MDNVADRDMKGRGVQPKGSKHGCAKLTEWQVVDIKAKLGPPGADKALAARYGVSERTIWEIKRGRTWRHVTGMQA